MSEEKRIAFYPNSILAQQPMCYSRRLPRARLCMVSPPIMCAWKLSATKAREEYDNQIIKVKLLDFNHDKSALKCEIIG